MNTKETIFFLFFLLDLLLPPPSFYLNNEIIESTPLVVFLTVRIYQYINLYLSMKVEMHFVSTTGEKIRSVAFQGFGTPTKCMIEMIGMTVSFS